MGTDPSGNRWDAQRYGELAGFAGDWRDLWWNADYLELMARRWDLPNVHSVVDVGCGVGHWSHALGRLLAPDAVIVGCDHEAGFAKGALDHAAARGLGDRFRFVPASITSLPFADGSFDMATCQTVLIHVADPRRAIREMTRVVRPGGLVAVAEPNNLASTLALEMTAPRLPWEDILALLDFQHTCEQGKIALGHGDSSVGDLLPGMFADCGLADVRVTQSDTCAALIPPYDDPRQAVDLRQMLDWGKAGIWHVGTVDDARDAYVAGGGDPARFAEHWARVQRDIDLFATSVTAGKLNGARGFVSYLVWGRKR